MGSTGWLQRTWWAGAVVCALAGLGQGQPPDSAPTQGPTTERPPIAHRRIVKHFDFNEEPLGNFESLPMFWRRNGGVGFPPFLEGRLDKQVGHAPGGPPSFRLDLDGASLAYHYEGRDISIRTSSDYLVVAWVRSESLDTARAYITAYYLDRQGLRIPDTEQASALVGGTGHPTDWQAVSVALKGNVPWARYIGITLWLTQADIWGAGPRPMRAVERQDLRATAWFDDITVYRLPRVTLTTAHPGNVFPEGEPVELRPEVSDPDGFHLAATLTVHSADGRLVLEQPLPIEPVAEGGAHRVACGDLPPGVYDAKLIVSTDGDTALIRRDLRFARLSGRVSAPADTGQGFGVVLRDVSLAALPGQRELVEELRAAFVKIPVWRAQAAAGSGAVTGQPVDQYVQMAAAAQADPIGVLVDDPGPGPEADAAAARSMLDLFSEDPTAWKPLVAGVWSRYAGLVQVWQVGADDDPRALLDPRLAGIIPALRREMSTIIGQALLATPSWLPYGPDGAVGDDYHSLVLPSEVPPESIEQHVRPLLGDRPGQTWLLVQPLEEGPYSRELRLADLARRLVEAHFVGTGGVFLSAPWDARADPLTTHVYPREDFIILRTVADVLGGSRPVSRTTIDGQAQCVVFDRHERAILFACDPYAPPEGKDHVLALGEQAEQIDLWGRRTALPSVGHQQVVRIGPTPTFIVHTPTWLMEFRRQFRVEPPLLEASFEPVERHVTFRNTYHEPISGLLHLVPPENWDVRPNRIPFVLAPGQDFRQAISVRFPNNAEAGVTPLVGEFQIDADRRYRIVTPAWFDLGLDDIDLDTHVYRAGDDVTIRLTMTNHTGGPVSFDGYLIAPGRPRIDRQLVNFHPGSSITKDFILEEAAGLAGRKVRVALKEIHGLRVWNRVITLP